VTRRLSPLLGARAGAALIAGTLTLGGCSVLPQSPPPLDAVSSEVSASSELVTPQVSPSPVSVASEVADGFSDEEHAAVRVRTRTCDAFTVGSGFMLDEHTLVTNRHVVEGAQTITLSTYDGKEYEATGSVTAEFADLALVTVSDSFEFAAQISSSGPDAGDMLDIVGYPLGGPLETRAGPYVQQVPDELVKGSDDVDLIEVQAEHGNSGSGVYNSDGQVVGVLYATDESGESFAVSLESLKRFLSDDSLHVSNDAVCS